MRRERRHALGCAIILLDSEPIRRKRIGVYRRLKRALEKARAEEERFELEDVPAFTSWVHRNFGERLSKIRELEAEAKEKENLVNAIHLEVSFKGGSYYAAYQCVLKRREAGDFGEEDEPFSPEFGDEEGEIPEYGDESNFFESEADFVESFADAFFENVFSEVFEDETEEEAAREEFHRSLGLDGRRPKRINIPKLKDMYRRLALRLHPDKNPSAGEERLQLWHELQGAYADENMDALLRVEAKCDIHYDTVSDHTTISSVDDIVEETREMLRAVRAFLTEAKKEPGWGFSGGECNIDALTLSVESDLWQRESWLLRLTEELDDTLKQWSQKPRRRRKKRGRSRRSGKSGMGARQDSRAGEEAEAAPFQVEFPF